MEIYYILKHNFLETFTKLFKKYKPQVPNSPSRNNRIDSYATSINGFEFTFRAFPILWIYNLKWSKDFDLDVWQSS
jgi:hypothetical protein